MMEEVDFNQHLDEFNKIIMELTSLEVKIEDEDKSLLLLASLPSSYYNIVTTLLFEKETLKFDEVVATLLMNEMWRANNGFQMMVRWLWLQMNTVGDEDNQKRRRKGPNVQDQVVGSSSVVTAMKKVILRSIV